ncbi:hypothetical protein B0H15DRAFT_784784 [Mycena belliarum]|uniref:Histone-lysine N-methyltransferase n=1 Tax=Mycena belliarum TaxID=1033014 RepID=A0AAD6TZE9_9AGAR|nr:hypothetical protein B0H15DRAFT_784784 [Mycena belliae]
MNESLYPVMTWDSYRRDLRNFQFPVYYAKDLASSLHDYINASDEYFRGSLHMRQVFESTILENTAEDEPDAPPIEVVNDVDAEPSPPWEFYYTNKIWLGEGIDPPDVTQLVGCDCKGKCDPKSTTCACLLRQKPFVETVWAPGFAYDHKGRLRTPGAPIFECNAMCACDDDECKNRVVQHGRKVSVSIKKTPKKGWGVFATKRIAKGSFIGVYSGEFLKDDVCERRGLVYDKSGRTYLLDIDFYHLGETKYVVDAYHAGNFTRFLNNSCNPNCQVVPCYINEPDIEKPLMTLFAKRDIAVAEELCFSYQGYDPDTAEPGDAAIMANNSITNKCFCGAPNCTGRRLSRPFSPHELTQTHRIYVWLVAYL